MRVWDLRVTYAQPPVCSASRLLIGPTATCMVTAVLFMSMYKNNQHMSKQMQFFVVVAAVNTLDLGLTK